MGNMIPVKAHDGGTFNAYLSVPRSGKGPGLLVLQEVFGVNDHIRAVTDRWAADGFVALAPDIFWRVEPGLNLGYTQESMLKAREIRGKLDMELVYQDIASTQAALKARSECNGRTACVGYCFGGFLTFMTAATTDVQAGVCYYGGGIERVMDRASSIKCPIMFHWGGQDGGIPIASREAERKGLAGYDLAEYYFYPDAQHGFNCDMRPSYNEAAAGLALTRSREFLKRTLGAS